MEQQGREARRTWNQGWNSWVREERASSSGAMDADSGWQEQDWRENLGWTEHVHEDLRDTSP
eukprot:13722891-Heterocapsa_arctica.AAC.1